MELNSTLNSIIGVKGVPLSYIIREEDDTVINKTNSPWDEKFVITVEYSEPEYKIEKLTVHQIILRNVAED